MNPVTIYKNIILFTLICITFLSSVSNAQQKEAFTLKLGFVLKMPRGMQEVIISPNPIEDALTTDKWKAPSENEKVKFINGDTKEWKTITADNKGWFSDSLLFGSYVYLPLILKKKNIMILQAMGNDMVYVNGAPRSGNPYCMKDEYEPWDTRFDYSHLPIILKEGKNDLLFRCSRGKMKVKLYEPDLPIMFNSRDITIPDFLIGENIDSWGSIVVINSLTESTKDLFIKTSFGNYDGKPSRLPIIQGLSVRKVPFQIKGQAINEKENIKVKLTLCRIVGNKTEILDTVSIPFRVIDPKENHKETFISKVDGSVQYYGINPASEYKKEKPTALFLSLHGAGVEGINQSGSYFPKTWGLIASPTNRRPYGFNWEEWGRLDALETLDIMKSRYNIDENRIYLTGHSMGGHGAWHIGSLYPDQFAAIGPSAGWISFWTYRYRGMNALDSSNIRKMIRRSTTPSETYSHLNNYKQLGVYILHGSDDDNVVPEQSRSMVEQLSKIHKDFVYYEQKGAGHWWDNSDEPGADCLDWPPMFDFFARHSRPEKERIREINFQTSNPGVSAKNNWLSIDAQIEQLKMSSVDIRFDPGVKRFSGTTKNVYRLSFDLDIIKSGGPITVELDSQKISNIQIAPDQKQLWLELNKNKWTVINESKPEQKSQYRYGTFKEAFRNEVIFVFGTKGNSDENEWAFSKSRFDAEKLWYQGNGSIDVIADIDFDPSKYPERNIILYGNKNTNAAWKLLLSDSPVQVGNNVIQFGEYKIKGDNLSCIFVRPRTGNRTTSIGIIAGTGITGMKITNRLPYLNPGIGLPDCTIFDSRILSKGEEGVLITGFFGLDWSIEEGEFIRKEQD